MKLYHGSNVAITEIDLTRGRVAKDFGKGFYLSSSLENTKEWADKVVDREESGVPTITAFDFDESCLDSGELIILLNRQNKTGHTLHDYDIVVGPIADDAVGTQLFQFGRGYNDKTTLVERLKGIWLYATISPILKRAVRRWSRISG